MSKNKDKNKVKKPKTASQIVKSLADTTGITTQRVRMVMEALSAEITSELSLKGPGTFVLAGCCKIVRKISPAKPERKGMNPFTGEKIMLKPKPAKCRFILRPMKTLKELKAE